MQFLLAAALLLVPVSATLAACPELLDQEVRVLRSTDTVRLCERYADKVVLVVNTASHCGFTPQFKGLEALYQAYKEKGLRIAGFPSDDFRQEADTEEATAEICYVNYGVSFDMYERVHVRGDDAHPLFAGLADAAGAPKWNFYKYLIDRDGKVVERYSSMTAPADGRLKQTIESLL
ncbi:MAG: glutathione peroxidase [Gammaproteobacteria bacterium]